MKRLAKLDATIKLDIGCGKFKKKGFVGIDWQDFGQEIVWDISHGIPLPDNSVSEVYTSHFVEHLKEWEVGDLFHELYRICQDGAEITIRCPHSDTKEAYYSSHYTLWNEQRIEGLCCEYGRKFNLVSTEREGINLIIKLIYK